jgi:hypothetical protein
MALGFAAIAAGFATATLRTEHIAHPVLLFPVSSVTLSGFVEIREERQRSDRIVVHVHTIEGRRLNEAPDRVRLAIRKDTVPAVGSFVELKAHLSPPLASARPAMRSARSRSWRRRSAPAFGCTMPLSSTAFARRSTSASAPSSLAMKVRSPRR